MIRITKIEDRKKTILRITGRIQGDDANELQRAAEATGLKAVLDLSELRMADKRGVEVLRSLADEGVKLLQVPPLIAFFLSGSKPVSLLSGDDMS
jgi:anti-anti-sigma regulatory factor